MTEEHILLNNTSWEEIQPSVNNINTHFKNQSHFSNLLHNFHIFIFHSAPLLTPPLPACRIRSSCTWVLWLKLPIWPLRIPIHKNRVISLKHNSCPDWTLFGHSFKCLQNIKGIYCLTLTISSPVSNLFLKTS